MYPLMSGHLLNVCYVSALLPEESDGFNAQTIPTQLHSLAAPELLAHSLYHLHSSIYFMTYAALK